MLLSTCCKTNRKFTQCGANTCKAPDKLGLASGPSLLGDTNQHLSPQYSVTLRKSRPQPPSCTLQTRSGTALAAEAQVQHAQGQIPGHESTHDDFDGDGGGELGVVLSARLARRHDQRVVGLALEVEALRRREAPRRLVQPEATRVAAHDRVRDRLLLVQIHRLKNKVESQFSSQIRRRPAFFQRT